MKSQLKVTPEVETMAEGAESAVMNAEAAVITAEAEVKAADRSAQAEAARARAAQFMAERRFADAKKALEEADDLESPPVEDAGKMQSFKSGAGRMFTNMKSKLQKKPSSGDVVVEEPASLEPIDPVDKATSIVRLYKKIAAGVGILPGGLLNFGAILAVQVIMVWKIANAFGHHEGKERIRGLILSLIGSAIPTGIGAGVAYSIASIPAVTTGIVAGIVVTPVIAWAMTRAVGNAFIMHFESGGTLLTFDPKAFREHFIKDLQTAAGTSL